MTSATAVPTTIIGMENDGVKCVPSKGWAVDRELAELVDDPVRREEGKEKVLFGQRVLAFHCALTKRCAPDGRDRADAGGSGSASAGGGTGSAGSAVVSARERDVRSTLPTTEADRAAIPAARRRRRSTTTSTSTSSRRSARLATQAALGPGDGSALRSCCGRSGRALCRRGTSRGAANGGRRRLSTGRVSEFECGDAVGGLLRGNGCSTLDRDAEWNEVPTEHTEITQLVMVVKVSSSRQIHA